MFSQNDEEKYILEHFKDENDGKFLDIGAYDGQAFSNTHQLALNGWSGVCVEPSPNVTPALNRLYKDNEKICIVEAAVAQEDGFITFYDSNGDAISSTNVDHKKKWETNAKVVFKEISVPTISMASIYELAGIGFDFVDVDVEGNNYEVLQLINFDIVKASMVCVEFDDKIEQIKKYLSGFGFKKVHQTGENYLAVR